MAEKHGEKVLKALNGLEERKDKMLVLGQKMLSAYGGALYPVDLLAVGAIKRVISLSGGIQLLINSFNMVCARVLLRIHIDTMLRFYAVFLVDNPHDFSHKVMGGNHIRRMQDKFGNKMTDSYLVSKLSAEYPWLTKVYKNLSGYVHLSEQHIFSSMQDLNEDARSVQLVIGEKDTKYPESSWLEILNCFNESTDIFIKYLEGWIFTKSNPRVVAKIKEGLNKS
jgi:hypothetical protein